MKKKYLLGGLFGLIALAAFAGTCTITRISLVSTDVTHKTFAGQLDNTSGVNILQHNFVVAFLDTGNNVLETHVVPGCLRSVPNGSSDYFSSVSTSAASVVSTGLARMAFDSTFRVGTTSAQNVSVTNITAGRNTTATPSTLTVTGTITNNSATTLISPNVCIVVRTSAGNVLITGTTSTGSISTSGSTTFTSTITVPNDSTASTVDVWVDGLDASSNPTTPQGFLATTVTTGGTATKLAFSTQPVGGVVVNTNFGTMPVVKILDVNGNVVTTGAGATLTVTLAVKAGTAPAGTVLTCDNNSVAAVAGLATFTNCKLNHAATGIVLTATSGALTSADSSGISINPGAATHILVTQNPGNTNAATPFVVQPQVALLDGNNDTVWNNSTSTVVLALVGTGVLSCTSPTPISNPLTFASGIATATGCQVSLAGIGDKLSATSGALTVVYSLLFDIGDQTITFGALANKTVAQSPVTVTATASSSLAVTFSTTTTAVCTVTTAGVVTLVAPGTCTIKADQAGNSLWNPAAMVSQSFTVS